MTDEKEFDVVVHALRTHMHKLWDLMNKPENWGSLDHIRMQQISELEEAIRERENRAAALDKLNKAAEDNGEEL